MVVRGKAFRPAQQRPGPKPRQHHGVARVVHDGAVRSTKAGTEAPATRDALYSAIHGEWRSTKAGTEAPATPPRGSPVRSGRGPLNKGRDRSPGNTCPSGPATPCRRPPLNKGRDRSPGNTSPAKRRPDRVRARSTKAGTEAPATHPGRVQGLDVVGRRSTKAGTEAPATHHALGVGTSTHSAQQRPGPKPRQHATRRTRATRWPSLNKGRDRSPGNTCSASACA